MEVIPFNYNEPETTEDKEPLDQEIIDGLNDGRRPRCQVNTLEDIGRNPVGFLYTEEVFLLACQTRNKEVYETAMKVLQGLNMSLYAEVHKRHPWGERRGSVRVFTPRSIN